MWLVIWSIRDDARQQAGGHYVAGVLTLVAHAVAAVPVRILREYMHARAGQLASAEWWETRGTQVPELPPESTLQDVLRDLVEAPALPSVFNAGLRSQGIGEIQSRSCHWTGAAIQSRKARCL